MTKRQSILQRMKTIIAAIPGLPDVKVCQASAIDVTRISFPSVFIYGTIEQKLNNAPATIGQETWKWLVVIEIWAKDSDFEDLLGKVHSALFADYRLGDLAIFSERIGAEPWVVDPTRFINGLSIQYEVTYNHPKGVM